MQRYPHSVPSQFASVSLLSKGILRPGLIRGVLFGGVLFGGRLAKEEFPIGGLLNGAFYNIDIHETDFVNRLC